MGWQYWLKTFLCKLRKLLVLASDDKTTATYTYTAIDSHLDFIFGSIVFVHANGINGDNMFCLINNACYVMNE